MLHLLALLSTTKDNMGLVLLTCVNVNFGVYKLHFSLLRARADASLHVEHGAIALFVRGALTA